MSTFHLQIDGENVAPETVELSDLLRTLRDLRLAILGASESPEKDDGVFLSLVKITKKCNQLTLRGNPKATAGRKRVEQAIRSRDLSVIPSRSHEPLNRLWNEARNKSWKISIKERLSPRAVIDPLKGFPRERVIKGQTTLYVTVMKAGGELPTADVRLHTGEILACRVKDQAVAQALGGKLYQHVVIVGNAEWYRGTQELKSFKVMSVGNFNEQRANPAEAMKELSRIMGHHWEGVDADEYLREERSDD